MKKTYYLLLILIGVLVSGVSFSQVTFTDVAPSLGVDDPGAAQGVTFIDVNNDGWLDIFLVNNNTPSKLWINTNGTTFTESSAQWGVNITAPTRGISAGDFDNDGFTDVMIGNWQQSIMLYKNTGTGFVNYSVNAGVGLIGYGGAINWLDYNRDGKLDVMFGNNGMPPRYSYFFRNDNLLSFTNVALQIGINDSASTLTIASADYDNDGDIDIFCGTQSYPTSLYTSVLFKNNGDGTFTEVTGASGITTNFYTWGAEWGDYNNDGWMDLFLASTTGYYQLYKNNGNGTFTDVSIQMGVNGTGLCYSCAWLDYDNDGDLDIYLARGQNIQDMMYRNDGTTFTEVATQVGITDLYHSSCVTAGDYNNDGWVDVYLNNNGNANRLYKNNGGNSNKWAIFRLRGVSSNRSAIGSRVTVKTGSLSQIREVEGGSGGKGQNSLPLEFGLGTASVMDSVIVRWANGLVQRFANVAPNTIYNLMEGQPLGIELAGNEVPEGYSLEQNYPNPFNPVTKIRFAIPPCHSHESGNPVKLTVFDILGKEVATLVNESLQPGTYEISFDAASLSSGVYFYKMTAGDFSEIRKMVLIR